MEQITLHFPSKDKQSYYPGSKGWNNHYQAYRHEAFGESGVEKTTYKVPLEKTKYSGYIKASGLPTFAYKIPDGKIWKSAPNADRLPRGGSVPRIIGTSSEGTSQQSATIGTQTQGTPISTQTTDMTGTPQAIASTMGTQTANVPERMPEYTPPTPTYEYPDVPSLSPETMERYKSLTPFLGKDVTQLPSPKSISSMGSSVKSPMSIDSPMSVDSPLSYTSASSYYSTEIPQDQTSYAGNVQSILMDPPQVQSYLKRRADSDPRTELSSIPNKKLRPEHYVSDTTSFSKVMEGSKYMASKIVSGVMAGSKLAIKGGVNVASGVSKYIASGTGEGVKAIAKQVSKGKQKMFEKPTQKSNMREIPQTPKMVKKRPPAIQTRMKLRKEGPASLPEVTYENYKNLMKHQLVRLLETIGIYPKSKANKTILKQMVEEQKHSLFGTDLNGVVSIHITPK